MLKVNAILLKSGQHFTAKAYLRVHHILLDIDCNESLLTCDTGNRICRVMTGALYDPCSLILRCVCISDIDRNTCLTDRENGVLVKYACPHIRKLAKLTVCDDLDRLRMINNTWICDQETGNIGPVLIACGMHRSGYDGTGDVRSASGECLDRAICLCSVKSRNNCSLHTLQTLLEQLICLLRHKTAILVKSDRIGRIYKFIS